MTVPTEIVGAAVGVCGVLGAVAGWMAGFGRLESRVRSLDEAQRGLATRESLDELRRSVRTIETIAEAMTEVRERVAVNGKAIEGLERFVTMLSSAADKFEALQNDRHRSVGRRIDDLQRGVYDHAARNAEHRRLITQEFEQK